uniref:Uncharacterized protein n=1 Tax=Picea glauca TaxID=3330 RepID=A0A101LYD5_PICGL|nr:hypothetical protein ABT39_MTgene5826 [Picea glauca]QHR92308.1 hypothetical protein Q903MT_gene6350 [Picea sitchensis]
MLPILGQLLLIRAMDQKVMALEQAIELAWNPELIWMLLLMD